MIAAGNYMDSDAWAGVVVGVLLALMALGVLVALAAGRSAGGMVVGARDLSPEQKKVRDAYQARRNRKYLAEHSGTLEELRNAEQALRDKGIDPGTGLPLDGGESDG